MFTSPGPIAFSFLNIDIRWYGIMIALGATLGGIICYVRAEKEGVSQDKLLDVLLISVPIGIIGARLYYVIFHWNWYAGDFMKMINIREGGLAIHGGLIFGITAALIVCRVEKIDFLKLMDLAVPSIALGQAIGRWGNFFNSEAHGGPTDLPWAVYVDGVGVHPTFLYESIWCLILCIGLILLSRRKMFDGQIFCIYAVLYSLERFFVESLRTDSLMIGPFKQAQAISLCVIAGGILAYIWLKKRNKRRRSS